LGWIGKRFGGSSRSLEWAAKGGPCKEALQNRARAKKKLFGRIGALSHCGKITSAELG
jgi:hypothetical protein